MLLYRSATGALAFDPPRYVSLNRQRVTLEEFRAGKLDAAVLELFGLTALVLALARAFLAEKGQTVASTAAEHADRPRVQRRWSFGRGDPRAVWIRGRTVSAHAGDATYEASLDVHAANGFPPALVDALGNDIVGAVNAAVAALQPLACMCHTGADEMGAHGTIDSIVTKYDPRAPIDVQAAVGRCTVCNQGWTFEWQGDSHYDYSFSATEFEPKVGYSEDEVQQILADMRAGYSVNVGRSRGNTEYLALVDGNFRIDEWEDGGGSERLIGEDTMRAIIAADPGNFVDVLRKPLRRALRDALYAATTPETRSAASARLDELLRYGPCLVDVNLLHAVLTWPDGPAPDLSGKSGLDLYQVAMSAVGFAALDADSGAFGLRFIATVVEMMGHSDLPELHHYRASFHAMKGDYAAAMKDLEWERDHGNTAVAGELDQVWRKYTLAEFDVPEDDAAVEARLRTERFGPPTPPDVNPWDFVLRWPDRVVQERVWPIVSRLMVDDDVNVRGRTTEFVASWDKGRALTTPRLFEVAETRPELYDDQVDQYVTLRSELASALCNCTRYEDGPRIAAIARRLTVKEPLHTTAGCLGTYDPAFVIAQAKVWGDAQAMWFEHAAWSLALFHRDDVLTFLEAVRGYSKEARAAILERVEEGIGDDETATRMTSSYLLPPPTKPAPSPDELKHAIDL